MNPILSVCIPTYNSAGYLRQTLESVLTQSFTDYELVIVDNASQDGTVALVKSIADPRIRLHQNPQNVGALENHNVCLRAAAGKYIKFFCSDDIMLPGTLQKMVDALNQHPNVGLVVFNPMVTLEDLTPVSVRHHYPGMANGEAVIKASLDRAFNFLGGPSDVMFRKGLLGSLRFDPQYKWWGDFRFFAQYLLQSKSDYFNLDEVGSYYRLHNQSDTAVSCPPAVKARNVYDFIAEMSAFNHLNSLKLLLQPVGFRRRLHLTGWLLRHAFDFRTIAFLFKQRPVGPDGSLADRLQQKLFFWRQSSFRNGSQ
ncbi:MAG: glycosyltransferase [Verrucomicrobiota bacterium]|nr:glycosyltransferase [Verrucomicrobiota bacterium]